MFKKVECNVNLKGKVELRKICMFTDFFLVFNLLIFSMHPRDKCRMLSKHWIIYSYGFYK